MALNDVPCPSYKDKIRLKVFVLPPTVQAKQISAVDYDNLHVLHRAPSMPRES